MSTDEPQGDNNQEPEPPSTPASPAESKARKASDPNDVEFRFTGDPAAVAAGVPARDLTQADVDRLVTRRTIPEPGARGLRRGEQGFSEARTKFTRELTATGKFKKRS